MKPEFTIVNSSKFTAQRVIPAVVLLVLMGALLYFWGGQIPVLNRIPLLNNLFQNRVVAQVGQESIYQSDINQISKGDRSAALSQLVQQSITLQGAKDDRLISLDSTIYNSPTKNLDKRMKAVTEIQKKLNGQASGLQGTVVALWFDHADKSLSYAQAKGIAYNKISNLYNQVKGGQMTIAQAGDQIKKDSTLSQLDKFYQINAVINFNGSQTQPITSYSDFDKILRSLKEGELSPIYTASSSASSSATVKATDAGYLFGQVNKVVNGGKGLSFNDWYQQKQKIYKVSYY